MTNKLAQDSFAAYLSSSIVHRLLVATAGVLIATTVHADDAQLSAATTYQEAVDTRKDIATKGTISVLVENDLFGVNSTDRHFTNGLKLGYLSPADEVPGLFKEAAAAVPFFNEGTSMRTSYSLGHNIYTPGTISTPNPNPDDRPYAGWLYLGFGLVSDTPTGKTSSRLDSLELEIGMVGKASLAEPIQKEWHRMIESPDPKGWDHQLRNEPGLVLSYERKWQAWHPFGALGLVGDLSPHMGVALGNIFTHGAAGFTLRLGTDLPVDYGPPRIRPSLPGSGFFAPAHGFDWDWYLFGGIEGRVVGRNIFLDGNTFRDGPSVKKEPVVVDFQMGAAITVGRARLTFTHVLRTKEFRGQSASDQFGSFNLSFAL